MNSEINYSYLDKNVKEIRSRISAAAKKAGRSEDDVVLMSAIKSATVEEINYIHGALGIDDVGENRVQQLLERWDRLNREGLRVHFIGSLQTNKVKHIIDKVYMIHSLDSERLAAEIDKQARKHGIVANVLVEINSGGEESKGGISYEDAESFCLSLEKFEAIRLCGFMTMAPKCENKEDYYRYFCKTRELAEQIWKHAFGRDDKPVISMGMSESYEEAIECGATMVRVGRGMFIK